jgi:hypothetical protein
MKTLFFIAALLGSVYLILQTPAGKSWMEESEPELVIQRDIPHKTPQTIQNVEHVSKQVVESLEKKVSELTQSLNHKQQTQIDQLESRIAELENELVMGRIAQKQPPSTSDGVVTLHPYKQTEQANVSNSAAEQNVEPFPKTLETSITSSNNQLQRKRQARLQDIAEKMEMSSLQALVN